MKIKIKHASKVFRIWAKIMVLKSRPFGMLINKNACKKMDGYTPSPDLAKMDENRVEILLGSKQLT